MILVTGGGGQLGHCLKQTLKMRSKEVIAPTKEQLDVTNEQKAEAFFQQYPIDAVVHCAAYSMVDLAEEQQETCRRVNVFGTKVVADFCRKHGAYMLYISTDYVFDGDKCGPYRVSDRKNPLSVYGQSKSEGEDLVLGSSERNAVLRTSWLFGHSKRNFVEAILRNAKDNSVIRVVADQIGSPTYTEDLAVLIIEMLEKQCGGIYHGTSEGTCSWAEFAREILKRSGMDTQVVEVLSREYGAKAQRPKNSVLDKSKLDECGLNRLPHWEDALKRYLETREG